MTPLELQDDLVDELKAMFEQHTFKVPDYDVIESPDENNEIEPRFQTPTPFKRVPLNIYAQQLPVQESDDDTDPVPYIIVRLNSGHDIGDGASVNAVKLIVIIGIWDDDSTNQGHRDVMNIIQDIYERFSKTPSLKNKYAFAGDFNWALQEDAYFPYHFGACSMAFNIPAIRREDPLT